MKSRAVRYRICVLALIAALGILPRCAALAEEARAARPKAVVIFYADDLGYNDTSVYGSKLIPSPNLEKLAAEGVKFTDFHSCASVSTPSRYSILTGQCGFRLKNNQILDGDAKLIVPCDRPGEILTLPAMMKKAGYRTAAIGKWHLGMGEGPEPTDWNKRVAPGANEVGFDYSYLMAATADRVPCVFLRNGCVAGLDPSDPIEIKYTSVAKSSSGKESDLEASQAGLGLPDRPEEKPLWPDEVTARTNPELLKWWGRPGDFQHDKTIIEGISRIGHMRGGVKARWNDQNIADDIAADADRFLESAKGEPVFLYFCTADIHVPRDPNPRFRGKSGLGIRGDVSVQMDDTLGQLRASLKKHGYDDCLFIFTSDNGPAIYDGYLDGAREVYHEKNENPSAPFSGGKYTLKEGGTRVPTVVAWPGHVEPGKTSSALLTQTDLPRMIADIIGYNVPEGSMRDSLGLVDALLGKSEKGRDELIEEAGWGAAKGFRRGKWKLISTAKPQLYDVEADPAETKNLAEENPELTRELLARLAELTGEVRCGATDPL